MNQSVFPFSAIVGHERLKLALRLVAVDPKIGGVLVRGPKGIAKSTAARSLARLLERVEGRPVPFVDLPLGASEDRVVGTLDVTRALREGERRFQPGLLFSAHGGVLYVDEVNLLTDYLVDLLLDAAASGVLVVERDGISERHPAWFQLIGTMNPEEGELRPQLLDRFALCCDLEDLVSAEERSLAVRRRLAFDEDPEAFEREFAPEETLEVERLIAARRRLRDLLLPDDLVEAVSRHALAHGALGLRADLIMCRAARAHAALCGATETGWKDVEAIEELVLAHRRTRPPDSGPSPPLPFDPSPTPPSGRGDSPPAEEGDTRWEPRLEAPAPRDPEGGPGLPRAGHAPGSSRDRRFRLVPLVEGRLKRSVPYRAELSLDVAATLVGRAVTGAPVLRSAIRLDRPPVLTVVGVDASGSMGGRCRIAYAKGLLARAMLRAYQRRHRFALVAFRGGPPCEIVKPTRALQKMLSRVDALRTGGGTSIAVGLEAARALIETEQRRRPSLLVNLVLVTDGRSNRSVHGRPPLEEALAAARRLAELPGIQATVVDAEGGTLRLGLAVCVGGALGASVEPLAAGQGGMRS